jgi:hypothetical protein
VKEAWIKAEAMILVSFKELKDKLTRSRNQDDQITAFHKFASERRLMCLITNADNGVLVPQIFSLNHKMYC